MPDFDLAVFDVQDFVFLGYCAKRSRSLPVAGRAHEIASVSECLSQRPDQWVNRWDYNRATCWNTEAEAWACVPDAVKPDFRLFAYRILPVIFDDSVIARPVTIDQLFSIEMPDLPISPPQFRRLGYDVVERNATIGMLGFGCSPLSCNQMAERIPVNRYCLLEELQSAASAARRFAIEKPEPGPYVIVEVLATA